MLLPVCCDVRVTVKTRAYPCMHTHITVTHDAPAHNGSSLNVVSLVVGDVHNPRWLLLLPLGRRPLAEQPSVERLRLRLRG